MTPPSEHQQARQSGYFVSTQNRTAKARKIECVLKDFLAAESIENKRILDIGCGTGQISEYFARSNQVYCVDLVNNLQSTKGNAITFKRVDSELLPFSDRSFHIVISNHVVEHVRDQRLHLREIKRVLMQEGVCYFATPNRSFLLEPHYKIPLIHYLPDAMFHGILRLLGKYKEDLSLLRHGQMISLFAQENLQTTEYTSKVLKDPSRFELGVTVTRFIPRSLLHILTPLSPTNIFVLQPIS